MSRAASDARRPPYDRVRALRNLEDSEDLLREIADIFVTDYRGEIEAMHTALAAADADTLFRLAHTMKSSMASFCADEAFEATSALVRQARTGRLEGIGDRLAEVERLADELANALRGELP